MFALHSAPAPDLTRQLESSLAAIVYANDEYPDEIFKWIVSDCRSRHLVLSGVLQHPAFEGADKRCDVLLEDLASGHRTLLFEDRGAGARGCRLDVAALVEASMKVESSLDNNPALLVLNKFGKVEADGGGMCGLIPAVIGVPARNLDAWRNFSGEFSTELSEDTDQIGEWLAKLG
ncbi:MAG: DUF2478 domain-containing protein [Afipia sp.]|nr:DUF2478 domain-containing protein [Afipia sp.]